jgi:6-phosphofructokinase
MARFGILTGGGDAPALNAVIRAAVRRLLSHGHTVVGIRRGWKGLLTQETVPLDRKAVSGILHRGGTILGTSRTNPYKSPDDERRAKEGFRALSLDGLIACGGEDTLGVANRLVADGFPVVGVPKTIDNDLSGTDVTFGFDTAVSIATEAIDRLHSTAESHDRVIVVEVLIPEVPARAEDVVAAVEARRARGLSFSIIVVAEGAVLEETAAPVIKDAATDAFGHQLLGGIGEGVAQAVKEKTGLDTRTVVLGHVQRGGTPTARDRWLGTMFGMVAADLAHRGEFGKMAALRGERVVPVPIAEGVASLKTVDSALYDAVTFLFG